MKELDRRQMYAEVEYKRMKTDLKMDEVYASIAQSWGTAPEVVRRNYLDVSKRVGLATGDVVRPNYTKRLMPSSRKRDLRVLLIGDSHVDPRLSNERFEWIGNYARYHDFDHIVQIGDFITFDSLCKYTGNDTAEGREKPTYDADLAAADDAMGRLGLDGKVHITLGNHEERVLEFANQHPEIAPMMVQQMFDGFEKHGWTYSEPYEVIYLGGVGFVHVPLNEMGKRFGGKTAEQRIANESLTDICMGHSHRNRVHTAAKIGDNQFVRVLNAGTSLPEGHIERYAMHSQSGWTYGIYDLIIRNNHVDNWHWVPMTDLERNYG